MFVYVQLKGKFDDRLLLCQVRHNPLPSGCLRPMPATHCESGAHELQLLLCVLPDLQRYAGMSHL